MKRYILFLCLAMALIPHAYGQEYSLDYYVNDYAGVLSPEEMADISSILEDIYISGKAEYAVLIVDSLDGQDIESFSYNIAEGNLGDTETNNGLLLIVAVQDRRYRFEVGRGLEGDLPDIIMGRIARTYLVPAFQAGDYGGGIIDASRAIREILLEGYVPDEIAEDESKDVIIQVIVTFAIIILVLMIYSFVFSFILNKFSGNDQKDDDAFTAAFILGSLLNSGRKGGGSFGGGFGGFGGGSFGGGGASGGW